MKRLTLMGLSLLLLTACTKQKNEVTPVPNEADNNTSTTPKVAARPPVGDWVDVFVKPGTYFFNPETQDDGCFWDGKCYEVYVSGESASQITVTQNQSTGEVDIKADNGATMMLDIYSGSSVVTKTITSLHQYPVQGGVIFNYQ